MQFNNWQVKLESFDGPLALLLAMIQEKEMDIATLDIKKITEEYLQFLDSVKEPNFSLAGEYLFMAATLVFLKSQECLDGEKFQELLQEKNVDHLEIKSKTELIKRLLLLKIHQTLSLNFSKFPKKNIDVFSRPRIPRKDLPFVVYQPLDVNSLVVGMVDILKRKKRELRIVKRDTLTIKEKFQFLKKYLQPGESTSFFKLLEIEGGVVPENKVITFMSLLELARLQKVSLFQNENLNDIYVEVKESLNHFDFSLAQGFEMPPQTDSYTHEGEIHAKQ